LFDHLIVPSARRSESPQTEDTLDQYWPGEAVFDVGAVGLGPDGRQAVISARSRSQRRGAETEACLLVFELETGGVTTIEVPQGEMVRRFDCDRTGSMILYADAAHSVVLWDVVQDVQCWRAKAHTEMVNAVAMDAEGGLAFTCSRDRSVRVWRLTDGAQLAAFTADAALSSLAVSADGSTIAVGDMAGRVHLLRFLVGTHAA
jgi:WD40 repeat protein